MNIMIISNDPNETSKQLSVLHDIQPHNQNYLPPIVLETESAVPQIFDLDLRSNANLHALIIADSFDKLWQGAREELLDMVIIVKNTEAGKWLANLMSGNLTQ